MEFKDPKRKRWCNLELEQPFPIFIQSEIGVPIENWVPFVYTGVIDGFGVMVKDPAEINALHSMGNFGKGCSSRSRPDIMRNNSRLPQIISKHQYLQRQLWAEKEKCIETEELLQTSADDLLKEISELHASIDNIALSTPQEDLNNVKEMLDDETLEILDISSDEDKPMECANEESKNVSSNKDNSSSKDKEDSSVEDFVFPMHSVVVLSDSDLDNEDCLKKMNPKLCIDQSKYEEYLILTFQEAYFLAFGLGCLQVSDQNGKVLKLKELWKTFSELEANFCLKYIIYHFYRSKGWIVKPGIKFGGDYLLYKEGQPYYHASYIVLIDTLNNKVSSYDWKSILGVLRMAGTAAKEVIVTSIIVPEPNEACILSEDPRNMSKYKVSEMLLRRWISNQERGDDDAY